MNDSISEAVHTDLTALLIANKNYAPAELAGILMDAGYLSLHYNIPAQIIDWAAYRAEDTLRRGAEAEEAAQVPGETGRNACIEESYELSTDPDCWLHTLANELTEENPNE